MASNEVRVIRFLQHRDTQGRTVVYAFTKDEREAMETGLKNRKGLVLAESLEEVERCDIEPDLPFAMSECGMKLQTDPDKKQALQTSRERWLEGDEKEALELLRDAMMEG